MPNYTSYKHDKDFLKQLDREKIQNHYVKIEVLDMAEKPLSAIQGRCLPGASINFDGSSNIRETCNINFVAEERENDLTDVDNLLSINKRIAVYEGIENNINSNYPSIIWLKQGIFVINQINISHNLNALNISLTCKDKMCLLNGEFGGGLPASITFDTYDQLQPDGSSVSIKQRIYDIIFTLVHRYGGIDMDKIFISDIELQIKQSVRFTGSGSLYFNVNTGVYTLDASRITSDPENWTVFSHNEDVGYVYTDFVYPGELVSGIGENVCTILDKIKSTLGNFEYFFDRDGNFHFQEIKNYLNNSYIPTDIYRLDNNRKVETANNGLCILNDTNYELDVKSNSKSVYDFLTGELIMGYNNSPNYTNIKNDFHIWGATDKGQAIHYHIAIKEKPKVMRSFYVYFIPNSTRIRLATPEEIALMNRYEVQNETLFIGSGLGTVSNETLTLQQEGVSYDATKEKLTVPYVPVGLYTPSDWRAELYLEGLEKIQNQIRPDVFEQELLDLFDDIYDFQAKQFKADLVKHPNDLMYFFDYLEPVNKLYDYSVDVIGLRTMSIQQDKIKKLYNVDIPNYIMININEDPAVRQTMIERCQFEGQPYSNIDDSVAQYLGIGTIGYTAEEVAREQLYLHTNYNEAISLQVVPIYHIEPNTRITVKDLAAGIDGDYIIRSISLPLGGAGTMSISAGKALERI